MKKLFILVSMLLMSIVSFAQEDNNRTFDDNVIKGPYLTNNNLLDNSFISIGAGSNLYFYNYEYNHYGFSADAFVGKWYTPTIGTRFGYRFAMVTVNDVPGHLNYFHHDILWNISHALGGYKESRLWNVSPYLTYGFLHYDNDVRKHFEFGSGLGVYNTFKISDRVNFHIDLSTIITRAKGTYYDAIHRFGVYPNVNLGFTFNLGKHTGFKRLSSVLPPFSEEDYRAVSNRASFYEKQYRRSNRNARDLSGKVDSLNYVVKDLSNTVDALKKAEPQTNVQYIKEVEVVTKEVEVPIIPTLTVYFSIGSAVIEETELAHIDVYASSLPEDVVLTVTGSTDSETGTSETNAVLAEKRANAVKDVLVNVYGLNPDNITTATMSDAYETPVRSRVAIVE